MLPHVIASQFLIGLIKAHVIYCLANLQYISIDHHFANYLMCLFLICQKIATMNKVSKPIGFNPRAEDETNVPFFDMLQAYIERINLVNPYRRLVTCIEIQYKLLNVYINLPSLFTQCIESIQLGHNRQSKILRLDNTDMVARSTKVFRKHYILMGTNKLAANWQMLRSKPNFIPMAKYLLN